MSTTTRTRKNRPTTGRATGSARTLRSVPEPTGSTATGRTNAEDKLWQALHANPNSTAAELSAAAGIGKSTAQKILVKWAGDGSVTRTPGIAQGGHRAADRWAILEVDTDAADPGTDSTATPDAEATAVADTEPTDADTADAEAKSLPSAAPTDVAPVGDTATEPDTGGTGTDSTVSGKGPRLAPGALRGLVEDYLRDHAGEQFSPNAIGKALNRSSGAVNNLCGSSDVADIDEDAVRQVLEELEREGRAVRVGASGREDELWRPVPACVEKERLPKGALAGLVEDFLTERAGEEFGPAAIGKALARSSGAVANALVRLTERGVVEQTCEAPRRYRIAASD